MTIKANLRFAKPEDMNQIVDLCELHANFERAAYTKKGKAERLLKALFLDNPKLYCLVVEDKNKLIAYATFTKQYATWDAAFYLYLDCLFVIEKYRGLGIGELLINKIKKESNTYGCDLIQWQTPSFNKSAIKFYKKIGAVSKSKERFFLNVLDVV